MAPIRLASTNACDRVLGWAVYRDQPRIAELLRQRGALE